MEITLLVWYFLKSLCILVGGMDKEQSKRNFICEFNSYRVFTFTVVPKKAKLGYCPPTYCIIRRFLTAVCIFLLGFLIYKYELWCILKQILPQLEDVTTLTIYIDADSAEIGGVHVV